MRRFPIWFLLLAACRRGHQPQGEAPAPSSSVISLGIALGDCDDLAQCERECEGGVADECRRLAVTYAFGHGVQKDEAHATALHERACTMGDPSACMFAGQMYEFGRGVAPNDGKAVQLYQRSCDLSWVGGCYNLAIMYERGTGVLQDSTKAAALYQTACDRGAREACDRANELRAAAAPTHS